MDKLFYLCAAFTFLTSCNTKPDKSPNTAAMHFVDLNGIDSTIKPGDNFFRYVNGKWYDTAKIADDQTGVGSYMFLNIPQKQLLQHLLDSVSTAPHTAGSVDQQVGDFYASGMDTVTINQRGYQPVQPILTRIDAITDVPSLMKLVAAELTAGNHTIISLGIAPDNKNGAINIAQAYQGGIGLPDRDYYFKTDSSSLKIQQAYKKYMGQLFQLTGSDAATAAKNADIVYGIEKQIAASHKTNIELRDVDANYHKTAIAAINKTQPAIGWQTLLTNIGAATDSFNMAQPAYYASINGLLTSVPISDWKIYMKETALAYYAGWLSKPFTDASFELTKVLSGQAVQKSRQQIMTMNVDTHLGEALGQLYVKRYFNEDAKKRVLALVNKLQKSFENRINQLDWMSDSTKQKAKEKLYAIGKKIGYPDKWRSYDKVLIDKNKFFENMLSLNQNDYQFQLARLNKPIDKTAWSTTPSTVTAYNSASPNEIVFPAGILQFPYFDFGADDAINYGGIGMVIGHEMTHAFDDQGAQYDKEGNVKKWWTNEDYEKFRAKTKAIVDLYSSFTVLDTVHIKGGLTVGENVADNGGVAIAYDAFKMTEQGKDTTKIDGFTPDQRFFLSLARIWRVKTRDAFLRLYVNTNPHSPAMWRVNGPLMNFAPFYKAFNVQPGDRNYKSEDQRIKIW